MPANLKLSTPPLTVTKAASPSLISRAMLFGVTWLPRLVLVAKLVLGWAWLWSWPIAVLLLVLALVGLFIGRPLPGWREIAATVVRFGVRRGLVELAKWLWSRL